MQVNEEQTCQWLERRTWWGLNCSRTDGKHLTGVKTTAGWGLHFSGALAIVWKEYSSHSQAISEEDEIRIK